MYSVLEKKEKNALIDFIEENSLDIKVTKKKSAKKLREEILEKLDSKFVDSQNLNFGSSISIDFDFEELVIKTKVGKIVIKKNRDV
jgi:hypothetical protein